MLGGGGSGGGGRGGSGLSSEGSRGQGQERFVSCALCRRQVGLVRATVPARTPSRRACSAMLPRHILARMLVCLGRGWVCCARGLHPSCLLRSTASERAGGDLGTGLLTTCYCEFATGRLATSSGAAHTAYGSTVYSSYLTNRITQATSGIWPGAQTGRGYARASAHGSFTMQ